MSEVKLAIAVVASSSALASTDEKQDISFIVSS